MVVTAKCCPQRKAVLGPARGDANNPPKPWPYRPDPRFIALPVLNSAGAGDPCGDCGAKCCKLNAKRRGFTDVCVEPFELGQYLTLHGHRGLTFRSDDSVVIRVQRQCMHLLPDNRCGIYETRPIACRHFSCSREYAHESAANPRSDFFRVYPEVRVLLLRKGFRSADAFESLNHAVGEIVDKDYRRWMARPERMWDRDEFILGLMEGGVRVPTEVLAMLRYNVPTGRFATMPDKQIGDQFRLCPGEKWQEDVVDPSALVEPD